MAPISKALPAEGRPHQGHEGQVQQLVHREERHLLQDQGVNGSAYAAGQQGRPASF